MHASPEQVSAASSETQAQVLDQLFEKCPQLTAYVIPHVFGNHQIYHSYSDIIKSVRNCLLGLASEYASHPGDESIHMLVTSIVSAHPRLGAPKHATISAYSRNEQKSLQGDGDNTEIALKLKKLNAIYEIQFPGLRYVSFVNGRSRNVIMQEMQSRIDRNNYMAEVRDAFTAMCDIALDRSHTNSSVKL